MTPYIIIGIGTLLALLLVVFLIFKKKGLRTKTDYRTLFIIGIVWLGAGVPAKNYALSAMGLVFLILGIINKDKWEKPVKWDDLDPKQKKV
jgi:hypothetical protein